MSRTEAFSEGQEHPFAITKRSVTIGSRTFPAVMTEKSPEGYSRAVIPMENGNLAHVDYVPPEIRSPHDDAYGVTTYDEFAMMNTPHAVHDHLDELSKVHLHPDTIEANKRALREHAEDPGGDMVPQVPRLGYNHKPYGSNPWYSEGPVSERD